MRVGLFGGSFNPIHLGHLRAAEEVREALKLDLVYFIPAASPPHKQSSELAPAEHRLAMVRVATKGNRHFMTSDVEIRRAGRSFTIDTVRHFLATLRQPAPLYLMMGADQFAELDTWKEPRRTDAAVQFCRSYKVNRRGRGSAASFSCRAQKVWLHSDRRSLRAFERTNAIFHRHHVPSYFSD